jgi:hypothetical protein
MRLFGHGRRRFENEHGGLRLRGRAGEELGNVTADRQSPGGSTVRKLGISNLRGQHKGSQRRTATPEAQATVLRKAHAEDQPNRSAGRTAFPAVAAEERMFGQPTSGIDEGGAQKKGADAG